MCVQIILVLFVIYRKKYYFTLGNNLFSTIAAIAAVATGEPNKYCTVVGKEYKNSSGMSVNANVKIIGTAITYISFSPILSFFITCIPLIAMMPQTITNTPPITADGITEIKAANLLEKPNNINQAPAAIKTRRLAIPVMEIIPAFVE